VLEISNLPISTIFPFNIITVPTVLYLFSFYYSLNGKIVEIGKFDISNTHINDPSWLISDTSIKRDGVKLVYNRFF
jgi:hypothetical protein